jgi:hypothetical protein
MKPDAFTLTRLRKQAISAFILVYLFVMAIQILPTSAWQQKVWNAVSMPVLWTGLWQTFAVFVPNPRKNNIYIDATVYFEDGTNQSWQYPRMEQLSFLDKMQKERFRKYGNDHVYFNNESMLWPDLAIYIARQSSRPKREAVRVDLRRHWFDIPPISSGISTNATADQSMLNPQDYAVETFMQFPIHREDLR